MISDKFDDQQKKILEAAKGFGALLIKEKWENSIFAEMHTKLVDVANILKIAIDDINSAIAYGAVEYAEKQ